MRKGFAVCLVLPLLLLGCVSLNNKPVLMHGMIVNNSNIPIPGVEIFENGSPVGKTNSNGFFEIEVPCEASFNFETKKSGWETKTFSEQGIDRTKLYIYQIRSLEHVYADIEKHLLNDNLIEAEKLIEILENEYGDKETALLLKSVVAYRMKNYEEAENYLIKSGMERTNPYVKHFHEKIGGEIWNQENQNQ